MTFSHGNFLLWTEGLRLEVICGKSVQVLLQFQASNRKLVCMEDRICTGENGLQTIRVAARFLSDVGPVLQSFALLS